MKAILWDLDGTVLPVSDAFFFGDYLRLVSQVLPGIDPKAVKGAIMATLGDVMSKCAPGVTVETRFAQGLEQALGMPFAQQAPYFQAFYETQFPKLGQGIDPQPQMKEALQVAREKGYRLVLATNPVIPGVATRARMAWAGVTQEDFEHVTYYEDCCYTKPHAQYYQHEVLDKLGLKAQDCIMVGNDGREDMQPAGHMGMGTFLVTDYALSSDMPRCWDHQGNYGDLLAFIRALPMAE